METPRCRHGHALRHYDVLGADHLWSGGGGPGKSGEKKTQRLLAQEKKTQLNNPEEKKLNSTTWKKKKTQLNNLEEKKKLNSTTWKKKKFIMDFILGWTWTYMPFTYTQLQKKVYFLSFGG